MEFNDVILKRRSYRSYLTKEIEEDKLNEILKAGMHAPVATGSYEKLRIVVLKAEKLLKLRELLVKNLGKDPTYNSPTLVMIYHKGDNNDLTNLDAGCVGENIMLKARNEGLGSVMIYCVKRFFNEFDDLKPYLKSDEFNFMVSIALGYVDDQTTRDVSHKIEVIE